MVSEEAIHVCRRKGKGVVRGEILLLPNESLQSRNFTLRGQARVCDGRRDGRRFIRKSRNEVSDPVGAVVRK